MHTGCILLGVYIGCAISSFIVLIERNKISDAVLPRLLLWTIFPAIIIGAIGNLLGLWELEENGNSEQ